MRALSNKAKVMITLIVLALIELSFVIAILIAIT